MVVAAPALGQLVFPGEFADRGRHLVEGEQVGVHALALIQPVLLRGVGGEGTACLIVHSADVDVESGADLLT